MAGRKTKEEIAERNRRIAQLKGDGVPNREIARMFELGSTYISEIAKEEERKERYRDSGESLGRMGVAAFVMLSRAGLASQNALLSFISSEPDWKEAMRARFGARERVLEDIERFCASCGNPDLGAAIKSAR